jgi:tRNA pseudouridine38-40 synthase
MRVAIKFAYNGQRFDGYARQPGQTTVEGELINRLIECGCIENAKENCFRSASRTDKAVSALGNVIAFNTTMNETDILKKVNLEENDLVIYGVARVDADFYPRYAMLRIYRYYLSKKDIDSATIFSTASIFTGEHNFTNFARIEPGKNPTRTIDNIVLSHDDRFFILDFYAQTYLWNQIRRIISALQRVGLGKTTKEKIATALKNPTIRADFGLAPAEPLFLKDIIYDFKFHYDPIYKSKVKTLEKQIIRTL